VPAEGFIAFGRLFLCLFKMSTQAVVISPMVEISPEAVTSRVAERNRINDTIVSLP
jgi:hypothetical protein